MNPLKFMLPPMLLAGLGANAQERQSLQAAIAQPTRYYVDRGYAHVFHGECTNVSGAMLCIDGYQKDSDRVTCETVSRNQQVEIDRCWRGKDPLGRWTE
jgi:hypothetical protein